MKMISVLFVALVILAGCAHGTSIYGKGMVAAMKTPAGDIVGHTGGIKGFGASLYYHPERNKFICVMMNDDIKGVDPAVFKLLKIMMES